MTSQGTWTLTADGTYLLNGGASGAYTLANRRNAGSGANAVGTLGLYYSGGQLYAYNSDGSTYVWSGSGWKGTTQVPTPPAALGVAAAVAPAQPAPPPLNPTPPTSAVTPVGSATPPPATGAPSATVGTTSSGTAVTQADLQALVAQLASQGQTAQQAYASALAALQANGIPPTSGVQSAVQSAIQATPAPTATAGVSGLGWVGILLAGATVLFATARPVHSTPRRRRSRS
jgi:hypothetical protein